MNELTHLHYLESEAIHIIREAVIDAHNPVMLYSLGKDPLRFTSLSFKSFLSKTNSFSTIACRYYMEI